MDVLSGVLRVVRLSGVVHLRGEFTRPWALLSSSESLASRLGLASGAITPFHVVVSGAGRVCCRDLPAINIETGDVIVFPRGDRHVMSSGSGLAPTPMKDIYPRPSRDHIAVVNHGGPGEADRYICGYLHSDQRFNPLLASLPTLICIRSRHD